MKKKLVNSTMRVIWEGSGERKNKKPLKPINIATVVFIGLMVVVALAYLVPMVVVDMVGWGKETLSQQEQQISAQEAENEANKDDEIIVSLETDSEDLMAKDIGERALNREDARSVAELAALDMTEDMVEYWVFLSGLKQEDIATYKEKIASGVVGEQQVKVTQYAPVKNENLPEGLWLQNATIGLNAQVYQGNEVDLALERGVVAVPGYGEVGVTGVPVIMAAHKFGMKWWWNNAYGRENSFYYLDQLPVGSQVVVIYGQREWRYEIYNAEYGEKIQDYQADLILYTCRFLTSSQRYFVSLRLVDPASYGEVEVI